MNYKEAKILAQLTPKIMNAFHDLGRQHPKDIKLSMRQFQALIILNANGHLTLSQLCEKLSLAPSTGTELVNRMISLNYLNKTISDANQRQVILSVSENGLTLLKEREKTLTTMFEKFLEPFDIEDTETFINSFQNIWTLIDKYHKLSDS